MENRQDLWEFYYAANKPNNMTAELCACTSKIEYKLWTYPIGSPTNSSPRIQAVYEL